jgi:hypothetical protein
MVYLLFLLTLALGVTSTLLAKDVFTPYVPSVDQLGKRQISASQAEKALNITWGPSLDIGLTSSTIIKFTTVFSPGNPPRPEQMKGTIFLWPGIWDPRDRTHTNLIQSVAEYTPPEKLRGVCNPRPGQWFVKSLLHDAGF